MSCQETYKIFCGNLSPVTTDNDLHEVFSKHGTVVEAVVMTGKNFGFVHMASEAQGIKALQRLENCILHGQKMVVQRAINLKRASSGKRNIIGQGVSNLDDFDNEMNEGNYNYHGQDMAYLIKNSSPSHYNNSINQIASNSNLSNNDSGRPSPLLISSTSCSYTPEHTFKMPEMCSDASENFSNEEDKSMCGICREKYDNRIHIPKILSCNHTFCLDCLISISKGVEIKCPLRCPYITILQESGVSGLTTNQTKIIINDAPPNFLQVQEKDQSYESKVCCVCLRAPPDQLCSFRKHEILSEGDAFNALKPRLKNLIDMSLTTLRNVMTMEANLKERMQYTLHSLTKFSEELKMKIEGEEFQHALHESHLVDLRDCNISLLNTNNIFDVLKMYDKVENFNRTIFNQYKLCFAKDAINGALDSIVLQLKEPLFESYLSQLGFSKEEAFSLASTLRENADKGNFANVLLIYLLCDLLSTRYRTDVISPLNVTSTSHSFGNTQTPNVHTFQEPHLEEDNNIITDSNDIFNINKMIETTNAIESCVSMNGTDNGMNGELYDSQIVSSALSLGISNISLIGSDKTDEVDEEDRNGAPRPVSYLDAVKKPAKQPSGTESQAKQSPKLFPSPMKPSKFPHCWMVVSVNGNNVGRIIFQLRPDKAPKMCDNFIGLCTGRSGYGYKGTHFFKNGDGFLVGGDVENDDGTGGYSVYDKQKFEADLCPLKDDVGMVRFKGIGTSDNGRGMVGSQFMIWYTEREFKKFSFSLVFGRIVDGLNIVQEAANHNLHKVAIKVEDCGAAI